MAKKFDPKDPSTWPGDYRQCAICGFGGSSKEVKRHLKEEHGK